MAAKVSRFALALAIAAVALAGFGIAAVIADHRPIAGNTAEDANDVWCC